jgi:hypothetical protein
MSCRSRATIISTPLTQIRRRYKASCYDLHMTVENDAEGWRVEVRDRQQGKTLHAARRCSLDAAKLAAAEFAVIRMTGGLGAGTVDVVAKHLPWDETW